MDKNIDDNNDNDNNDNKKENNLFFRVSMSIIIGLDVFILMLFISFFIKKPLLIPAIITSIIVMILIFIYQTLRKEKNLLLASLLNLTPLYPVGFLYTTEQALPKFNIKQIGFFFTHFFLNFTILISPFITFISGWLGYYPVKDDKKLKLF